MTDNIRVADRVSEYACPICLNVWTRDMAPVQFRLRRNTEIICGQCAAEIGRVARLEQRRRRQEKAALQGRTK